MRRNPERQDERAGPRSMRQTASRLQPTERFGVLEQVASTLRTSMVNDVESRLR